MNVAERLYLEREVAHLREIWAGLELHLAKVNRRRVPAGLREGLALLKDACGRLDQAASDAGKAP